MAKKKTTKRQPPLLFISYSHIDDECRKRFRIHLKPLERSGVLRVFDDTLLDRDTGWRQQLMKKLNEAEMVLLLVSPDFLDSDSCFVEEWPIARRRWEQKKAMVTFALLGPCQWKEEGIGELQGIPKHGELLPPDKRGADFFWDAVITKFRKDAGNLRIATATSKAKTTVKKIAAATTRPKKGAPKKKATKRLPKP